MIQLTKGRKRGQEHAETREGHRALKMTTQFMLRVFHIISCGLTHKAKTQKGTQNSINLMQTSSLFSIH